MTQLDYRSPPDPLGRENRRTVLLVWGILLIIMGVILLVNLDVKANVAGAFHYAVGFVWSGFTSVMGPFMLLGSDIDWKAMPGNKISKHVFSVLRGVAVALPLLLLSASMPGASGNFSGLFLGIVAVLSLLVLLLGELTERWLFFTSVVAPKMPGAPAT